MSLDLDGTTASVDLGAGALDITGTTLTICCWFRHDVTGASDMLVAKGNAATIQYRIWVDSGNVARFDVGNGAGTSSTCSGTTSISTGVWYHLCGRMAGSGSADHELFLNGVNEDTAGSATVTLASNGLNAIVGMTNDASFRLDGKVAEVAIWDIALSDAKIQALGRGVSPLVVRPGTDLKGYFPLWSSGHLRDLSGRGVLATNTAGVTFAHPPVAPITPGGKLPYQLAAVAASTPGGQMLLGVG